VEPAGKGKPAMFLNESNNIRAALGIGSSYKPDTCESAGFDVVCE